MAEVNTENNSNESVHILVAEDEKAIAKALVLKLMHAGYSVDHAADGEAAVRMLQADSYDLALIDIMMPGLDGFGVLDKMNELNMNIPTIVLSNLSQVEDAEKAKEKGAKDFFVKSDTSLAEVITHVEQVLASK